MSERGGGCADVEADSLERAADEGELAAGNQIRIGRRDGVRQRAAAQLHHLTANRLNWDWARHARDQCCPRACGDDDDRTTLGATILGDDSASISGGLDECSSTIDDLNRPLAANRFAKRCEQPDIVNVAVVPIQRCAARNYRRLQSAKRLDVQTISVE